MGVNGLTTLIGNIRQSIAATTERSRASEPSKFIVDGWAFIYWVYGLRESERERWFEGGDYSAYTLLVREIIASWLDVKLQLVFVFDGPTPHIKQSVLKSRYERQIISNSSFMRASASLRQSPSFQRETRILPPLLYNLTLAILDEHQPKYLETDFDGNGNPDLPAISIQFATKEADPQVALLAENLQGYAVSQDSDYFVLCGRGEGCLYVPLKELAWINKAPKSEAIQAESKPEEDDGFSPVGKKGKHQKTEKLQLQSTQDSLASTHPPSQESTDRAETTLRLSAYSSMKLASHLSIPPALLSLLAALVGNDYSNYSANFFRGLKSSSERIYEAARVIQEEWAGYLRRKNRPLQSATSSIAASRAGSGSNTPMRGRASAALSEGELIVDPVRYIVEQSVNKLLARSEQRTHSFDDVIDRQEAVEIIIDSVCTYSKAVFEKRQDAECDSFFAETKPNLRRLVQAYSQGRLSPSLVGAMTRRHVWPIIFVENPALQAAQILYCQRIREFTYAVLFNSYGLEWARTDQDRLLEEAQAAQIEAAKEAEDAFLDEVVSVATDSTSDHSQDSLVQDLSSSLTFASTKPDPYVWEEVRRGDKLSCEPVKIPSVEEMLAQMQPKNDTTPEKRIIDWSENARLSILFTALRSDVIAVRDLSQTESILVACLRYAVITAATNHPDKRSILWWRPQEAHAMLDLFTNRNSDNQSSESTSHDDRLRALHLAGVLQIIFDSTIQLQQALFLPALPLVEIADLFGNRLFKTLIAANSSLLPGTPSRLIEDITDSLFTGNTRSQRKERKKQRKL